MARPAFLGYSIRLLRARAKVGKAVGRRPRHRTGLGGAYGQYCGRNGRSHHLSIGRRQDEDPDSNQPAPGNATCGLGTPVESAKAVCTSLCSWRYCDTFTAEAVHLDIVAKHYGTQIRLCAAGYLIRRHRTTTHLQNRRHCWLLPRRRSEVRLDERAERDNAGAVSDTPKADGGLANFWRRGRCRRLAQAPIMSFVKGRTSACGSHCIIRHLYVAYEGRPGASCIFRRSIDPDDQDLGRLMYIIHLTSTSLNP